MLAPTGAEADALSTAFFVGGVELAKRYCESHPEIGVILLPEGVAEPLVFGLAPHECSLNGTSDIPAGPARWDELCVSPG